MPVPGQINWFEAVLGPSGSLWPLIREGDFSDAALDLLFRVLANISNALNGGDTAGPQMRQYRERLPDISDIPHTYTLAADMTDGSVRDIGNVQATSYSGKLYLQSSRHVIDVFRETHPDFVKAFHVPARLSPQDPQPDVAVARLSRVPITDESDMRVIDIPSDFNPREAGGQVNVIIGFKEDGGIVRHAGIVLPTPPAMLSRLHAYLGLSPVSSIDQFETFAMMQHGGLMLMPSFFAEVATGGLRAAGRSGSLRLSYSPKHRSFIPSSNFMAMIMEKQVNGLSLGFVDSATHAMRAYREAEERSKKQAPMRVLQPRPVVAMKGYFEISSGVYLRDFQRSVGAFETVVVPQNARG